jgi:hypothetical protein
MRAEIIEDINKARTFLSTFFENFTACTGNAFQAVFTVTCRGA